MSDLRNYISHYNCLFHDFTADQRITLDMYGAGDHIDDKFKKRYTKLFVETLRDLLE
jgi:hypothetical protein